VAPMSEGYLILLSQSQVFGATHDTVYMPPRTGRRWPYYAFSRLRLALWAAAIRALLSALTFRGIPRFKGAV
jgi:hypothetical protein